MKAMLSSVDQVVECRDYRIPATSINPMFESALGDKPRVIIYTKRDLGGDRKLNQKVWFELGPTGKSITICIILEYWLTGERSLVMMQFDKIISRWDRGSRVFFASKFDKATMFQIFKYFRLAKMEFDRVTGTRILVVGMPNVGKSTLINALRGVSLRRGNVARTGADPGVTRKIGSAIKIFERKDGSIYLYDTPGVFVPYMPDAESMLKLALCRCVKDSIIPTVTLADYLLFHINRVNPLLYEKFSPPTNEIITLLEEISKKTGRLSKGGVPDVDKAATLMIHLWRSGLLGTFIMDDLGPVTLQRRKERFERLGGSMNQAKKAEKAAKKVASEGAVT
jgi:ribosome biogenesis GTPase A